MILSKLEKVLSGCDKRRADRQVNKCIRRLNISRGLPPTASVEEIFRWYLDKGKRRERMMLGSPLFQNKIFRE